MKKITLQEYKRRMARVLGHIEQHLDAPLELERLAALACFSPYHFHRVFTGMMGEPLGEYVRRLRLERAAAQLRGARRTVIEIAFEAGYESHEAFTRAFRHCYGLTPTEFRLALQPSEPRAPSGRHYKQAGWSFRTRKGEAVMEVILKTLPAMRVAYVHKVGPYQEVGQAWDKLCMTLGKDGYLGGDQKYFGIGYDDPEVTDPAKIRYDACITVDENFTAHDGVDVQVLEGGEYAVALHRGPHHEVSRAYRMLYGEWLPRSGREMKNAPALEFYLNTPENTEPADLLTEICAPLKPLEVL